MSPPTDNRVDPATSGSGRATTATVDPSAAAATPSVDVFNEMRGKWPRRKFEKPAVAIKRNTQYRYNHQLAMQYSPQIPDAVYRTVTQMEFLYGNSRGKDMRVGQRKLAEARSRSDKTIQRHLAVARDAGFLEWEHRAVRDPETGKVRQLVNQYRLQIPPECFGANGKILRPDAPPQPDPDPDADLGESAGVSGPVDDADLAAPSAVSPGGDAAAESQRLWDELTDEQRAAHLALARKVWFGAKPNQRSMPHLVAAGIPVVAARIVADEGRRRPSEPRAGP